MKKLFVLIIVTSLLACSKKDLSMCPQDPTLAKVIGKWSIDTIKHLLFRNDTLIHKDSTIGVTGDYFNFTADNKVYANITIANEKDTGVYAYNNNKLFLENINGGTVAYNIAELSDHQFTLQSKEIDPYNEKNYILEIIKLKK